jgi:Pentapeptide repeats (8 copies)/NACHT domain
MQSDSSLSVSKPSSVWHRPIKLNFRELFKATGKGLIHGISGKWDDVAGDTVEAAAALGLEHTPEDRLWLLIYRSLHQAMFDLLKGNEDLLIESWDFAVLGDVLDVAIEHYGEFQVDVMSLFKQPKQLALLEVVKTTFQNWLPRVMEVADAAQAKAIADRLPSYFVFALNQEWRNKSSAYEALKEQETPFSQATEQEQSWGKYLAWLQKQVDEPMFLEPFGLRQVYVPLRAYFEQKPDDQEDESPLSQGKTIDRVVVNLAEELLTWVEQGKRDDGLRVICGGPGCGKSSFTKIIAAQLAEQGKRVLFVPLHLFDPMDDLMKALANYIQGDLDRLLPPNPLDKESSEERVVLIFDGLDELAMQGKVGAEIAKDFVQEVQRKLDRHNQSKLRLQVILSGRDLVVQANSSMLRGDRQVLHVLPYFVNLQREPNKYIDSKNLLTIDQRDRWWKNYGEVSGKGYASMPQALQRDNLVEITAQPLLNYLLALSYQRKTLVFSDKTNLNEVYADLLNAVYGRGWESKRQHRSIEEISKADFLRILEEVALAAWHGNGRTTTIQEIQNHFANNKNLKSLLAKFETGAEAGVTRLLTAFYFRQQGSLHNGDKTFEFTHKSFGEYLTAKAIVRGVERIQKQLESHAEDCESGWDERDALKFWAELCGNTAIDDYLYGFIRDEIQLRDDPIVQKWQQTFCRLIEVMLGHGMPMEKLDPRLSYQAECHHARNAEEALLAVLSCCSMKSQQISEINWGSPRAFGRWLDRLRGQQVDRDIPLAFSCLINLNLSGANLDGATLFGANLDAANLDGANLFGANLAEANLDGANLFGISWNEHTSWGNVHNLENAIDVPEALKQLLSQETKNES